VAVVSGRDGRERQIAVPTMAFSSHKANNRDGTWPAFGCLDVCRMAVALTAPGSEHDQAQVPFRISGIRQQVATSIQTQLPQGGQRFLGRKVLTSRIGLPQVGHCKSAAANDAAVGCGSGGAGMAPPGSNCCTLLSASRWLGL
jgi:hypothetical protein